MRIKEITDQYRRDFRAVYICESCKHEVKGRGYDDDNFHQNVIPAMKCEKCGESTETLGLSPQEYRTKYASWETV